MAVPRGSAAPLITAPAGQEWDFAPVFWVANPAGVSAAPLADLESEDAQPSTARGGARGNW